MPKVSLVVPCFNQEKFIAEALDSVLRQTHRDWECIVVDDGSTDGSAAIIQRYATQDHRILSFSKENGGVAAARNFGFRHATGSYFLPLDGDDKLHPEFLRHALACFSRYPDTDLVHCKTKLFGAKNKVWHLPEYSYEKLLWQNMLVNTAMYRREAFFSVNGYSTDMIYGFEDWEFYVRLLRPESQVRFIDKPLFLYRVKDSSRSSEQIESGKIEESQRLIYERNRAVYEQFADNPIHVFGKRLKEFAPSYSARYRRQIRYVHAAYAIVIAAMLGAGTLLLLQ